MTNEKKIAEINKLNKNQRKTISKHWMGRTINWVEVTQLVGNVTRVQVSDENNFWMNIEVGPRGGLVFKKFYKL